MAGCSKGHHLRQQTSPDPRRWSLIERSGWLQLHLQTSPPAWTARTAAPRSHLHMPFGMDESSAELTNETKVGHVDDIGAHCRGHWQPPCNYMEYSGGPAFSEMRQQLSGIVLGQPSGCQRAVLPFSSCSGLHCVLGTKRTTDPGQPGKRPERYCLGRPAPAHHNSTVSTSSAFSSCLGSTLQVNPDTTPSLILSIQRT